MDSTSWIQDFLRHSLMGATASTTIFDWASALLDALQDAKPDQDVHIFGVSRIPRMPNYLLRSTSENLPDDGPMRVQLTEQTAELFLSPVEPGIRILSQELPLSVFYDDHDGHDRRHELTFFDAICFDGEESSLVLALILNDCTASEYMDSEEVSSLISLVRAQALPLFERFLFRETMEKLEQEVELMTGMVRESTPELRKLSSLTLAAQARLHAEEEEDQPAQPEFTPKPVSEYDTRNILNPTFLTHVVQEIRQAFGQIMSTSEVQAELARAAASGTPSPLKMAVDQQDTLLRSLASISALLQPNVKPRVSTFSMQQFMKDLHPMASRTASPYKVHIDLDPQTRNVYASCDRDTLLRLCERLMDYTFARCAQGTCWIRVEENPKRIDRGFLMLEFEDDGRVPSDAPLSSLLSHIGKHGASHPRLRQGGAILFMLLQLFMERCGGKLKIAYGLNGGFTTQLIMPSVSRGELVRQQSIEAQAPMASVNDTRF